MGELLTRVTIWLALALYGAAQVARRRQGTTTKVAGRWLLILGCGLYLAHVTLAFQVHHHWSHAAAYASTAAQTETLTGWRWGGGIYINYLFSALWVSEATWWWFWPDHYRHRGRRLELAVRNVFLFMIVNGAIVFVSGPQRWCGVAIVGVLLSAWRPLRP